MFVSGNLALVTRISTSTSIHTLSCDTVRFQQLSKTYVLITGINSLQDSSFTYQTRESSKVSNSLKNSDKRPYAVTNAANSLVIINACYTIAKQTEKFTPL